MTKLYATCFLLRNKSIDVTLAIQFVLKGFDAMLLFVVSKTALNHSRYT